MLLLRLIPLALLLAPAYADSLEPSVYKIEPGDDAQYRLQGVLVKAMPGDVIELSAGRYQLLRQIDIATDNLTIRGQGSDQTVLSFAGQTSGNQGVQATGDNFVIEGLAIEDTAGNALKVIGSENVTFRDVRTEWTGEAQSSNGAYGIYPVQCSNVLIEGCVAIGASDAGIYVGQSRDVIIRGSRAERNVAGIEVENTLRADVYDNTATDNAGGVLVFDLPGLQQKRGAGVRVFQNRIFENNHPNFAAPGNAVASVPAGTGVMVMATDDVSIFDNDIADNQTANIALVSYTITQNKKFKDKDFDPISEAVTVRGNRFAGGGTKPSGELGLLLGQLLGLPLPDILYDGVRKKKLLVDGALPEKFRLSISDNGDAEFANFNAEQVTPANVLLGRVSVQRELAPYEFDRADPAPVTLSAHTPPKPDSRVAAAVYRTAPERLSDWKLFRGDGSTQEPVADVIPYELSTPLFSDYTTKRRFIRVPKNTKINYTDEGPFEFPDGTVIAKTFSYAADMRDSSKGERLLETRIEFLRDQDWYGFSYLWNDEQDEAFLTLGGAETNVSTVAMDGKPRTDRYEIPNANQCLDCHSKSKSYVPIGPIASNLNREHRFAHGRQNQLEYLHEKGLLAGLPTPDQRPELPLFDDPHSGSLDSRARAWLHVNCAHCHSPEGTARTSGLDLRLTQDDPAKLGYWKPPVAAGHGTGGRSHDIVPGKPDSSILLYRMESSDPSIRMPNLGRNQAPVEAIAMIREWIAQLPEEN